MEENKETVTIGFEKVPLKSEREEKHKKIIKIVLTIVLSIVLLIVGFCMGYYFVYRMHPTNKADAANTMGEIEAVLDRYWIYNDNHDELQKELEDKAFYGMTKFEEDPYTTYMSAKELEEFASGINMDFVGVGIQYSVTNGSAIINRVFVNSPAYKAGLQAGDIILKIGDTSVEGLSTEEIKQLALGEEGSEVIITVNRENEILDIKVIRAPIDTSVYCYTQDDYVVMELSSFGSETAKECISYLNQYSDYSKIIIDLRNNSGGYQTSVKEIAGLFIGNSKVYLRQKDSNGNEVADVTSCKYTYDNFDNIVLLVNGETASAAEVFTICLKESLDNVTIVGEKTYGKGVIQSTRYLLNGGVLKYSSFYWYSPNGVSIHKVGIKPDVETLRHNVAYCRYVDMPADVTYTYDSVSEVIGLCQKAFDYFGYKVDRTDGYFDSSTLAALNAYKQSIKLDPDGILDKQTYDNIIGKVILDLSNLEKDEQFQRAIEIVKK